jgi:hypothetical protein
MFESWGDVKDFSWFLAQLAIVCVVIAGVCAICLFIVVTLFNAVFPSNPPQPPAMNAPLLEIVRYCEPLSRDRHTHFSAATKTNQVTYTDNPEKFLSCMQDYEYKVER